MRRTTRPSDVSDIGNVCAFCGAALEPIVFKRPKALVSDEKPETVVVGYRQCSCSGAVAALRRAQAREAEQVAAREQNRRLERLRKAGIKPRYFKAQHPKTGEVVEACRQRRNVYIYGNTGALKSTLASAAAIAMVDGPMFKRVLFATTVDVLEAIRRSFGQTSGDPLRAYKRASVLILDDFGKESPTDWAVEKLFDLVNERYNELLPTVVTTQYEPQKLIERLAKNGGEENAVAIVSRLRSKVDGSLLIHLDGNDRRMQERKEVAR